MYRYCIIKIRRTEPEEKCMMTDNESLKGLSLEMDLVLMTCMVSFRPKKRRVPFLNFLGAPWVS